MDKKKILVGAAVAGILGASGMIAGATAAYAEEAKGHCVGANSCKGKSACHTATNDCASQNSCKGKGYIETTKADCAKLMKKDKKIKFEASES